MEKNLNSANSISPTLQKHLAETGWTDKFKITTAQYDCWIQCRLKKNTNLKICHNKLSQCKSYLLFWESDTCVQLPPLISGDNTSVPTQLAPASRSKSDSLPPLLSACLSLPPRSSWLLFSPSAGGSRLRIGTEGEPAGFSLRAFCWLGTNLSIFSLSKPALWGLFCCAASPTMLKDDGTFCIFSGVLWSGSAESFTVVTVGPLGA